MVLLKSSWTEKYKFPKSLHVPGLDCSLLSITWHGHRKRCTFFTGDRNCHLTFLRFSIEASLPESGDLQIKMEKLTSEDWLCDDFTYGVDTYNTGNADHLDIFARRLKALNQIHRGYTVTWAQSKKQLNRLTSQLQNTTKNDKYTDKRDDKDTGYDKLEAELQSTFDQFDKEHFNDIYNDETVCADNCNKGEFSKTATKSPPQYHLELIWGDKKDRLARHTLQSYFGGQQLKDHKILSKLGTGLSVIDNKKKILMVGLLVNHKQGKRKQKGTLTTSPLEVVDMDIGYSESNSPGGHKYVLVLVDKCTSNTFVYELHGTSTVDVVEALWNVFYQCWWIPTHHPMRLWS